MSSVVQMTLQRRLAHSLKYAMDVCQGGKFDNSWQKNQITILHDNLTGIIAEHQIVFFRICQGAISDATHRKKVECWSFCIDKLKLRHRFPSQNGQV
jgi:hypothetical protein